jgi:hypothetical protein
MIARRPATGLKFGRHLKLRNIGLALGLMGVMSSLAPPARAEMLPLADMLRGFEVTPAQCAATPNTAWVSAMQTSVCMRYYISAAGGSGPNPVVFLQGDKFGFFNQATGTFDLVARFDHDIDTRNLQRMADLYSTTAGTTGIYLARVGIDGSSGFHGVRETNLELNLTNAALEVIKQRYRFTGFNLVGQSGGSALIGGLLALRNDIVCAVPGSGPLAWPKLVNGPHLRPLDRFFPMEQVQMIVRNGSGRILVLTDPQDQRVPAAHQTPFVQALQRAGGRIEQFFVQATDPNHHGVQAYTYRTMAGCLHGASHDEIAGALGDVQLRLLARASGAPPAGAIPMGAPL